MSNEAFQVELDEICSRLFKDEDHITGRRGWLYILRNEVPAVFLGEKILHLRGRSLHHSDEMIWAYLDCLRVHEKQLLKSKERLTLVIPEPWGRLFVNEQAMFSPKTEAFMFRVPDIEMLKGIRADFYEQWGSTPALRHFSPDTDDPPHINTLPDVWIWFSQHVVDWQVGQGEFKPDAMEKALEKMFSKLNDAKEKAKGAEWKNYSAWEHLRSWIAADPPSARARASGGDMAPRITGRGAAGPAGCGVASRPPASLSCGRIVVLTLTAEAP